MYPISAVLIDQGRVAEKGWSGNAIQLTYVSSTVRPDVTPTLLPNIGDNYNVLTTSLSTQTVLPSADTNMLCKRITESYFADDHTVGSIYTVFYDTVDERIFVEPTDDEDEVVMSIQSGAEVDNYTYVPEQETTKLYVYIGGAWTQIESTQNIPKTTVLTNVQTTSRYRLTPTQIIALGDLAGHTNNATMWGQGIGCILYNGINAQPLQEVYEDNKIISWNVTNSYTIRYIPGVTSNSWNYIFYKGEYTQLSTTNSSGGIISLYSTASIPNDIA